METPPPSPMGDLPPQSSPLSPVGSTQPRHGCLTAWLIFMIVANALTALSTPFSVAKMAQAGLHPSVIGIAIIVLCAIANVIFAVALLRWQKWGFYGFVGTTILAFIVNLSLGLGIGSALAGLVGVGILYAVLNIGDGNKAWPRLR